MGIFPFDGLTILLCLSLCHVCWTGTRVEQAGGGGGGFACSIGAFPASFHPVFPADFPFI